MILLEYGDARIIRPSALNKIGKRVEEEHLDMICMKCYFYAYGG